MIADDWERQFGDDPDFQDETSTKTGTTARLQVAVNKL